MSVNNLKTNVYTNGFNIEAKIRYGFNVTKDFERAIAEVLHCSSALHLREGLEGRLSFRDFGNGLCSETRNRRVAVDSACDV